MTMRSCSRCLALRHRVFPRNTAPLACIKCQSRDARCAKAPRFADSIRVLTDIGPYRYEHDVITSHRISWSRIKATDKDDVGSDEHLEKVALESNHEQGQRPRWFMLTSDVFAGVPGFPGFILASIRIDTAEQLSKEKREPIKPLQRRKFRLLTHVYQVRCGCR
jgi:hypothetical protein